MKRFLVLFCASLLFVPICACTSNGIALTDEEKWEQQTSVTYGTVDVSSEKTALNYLTGEHNMAQDRVGTRPFGVSVNNIADTWPQSGIAAADIVIEMETEGGITRLMCLYPDIREIPLIGSVRSLRHIQIEAVYQIDPIIVHIGTSVYAEKAIAEYGMRTIDGDLVPSAIHLLKERRADGYLVEYCKYSSGSLIDDAVKKLNIDTSSHAIIDTFFNFVPPEESVSLSGGTASKVVFRYSSNAYDGDFRYDELSKTYLKYQRNSAQIDVGEGSGNTQLSFKNVLVLFAEINPIPNTNPTLMDVVYEKGGTGYYFTDGRYEEIIWKKHSHDSSFIFKKADGTELTLNAGKTMLSLVSNAREDTLAIT
jgi:Protein of unknown function (DUF3048).